MQVNPVYLYRNKSNVFVSADPWTTERYRQVYQRNFKVYRGVDNKLDFQVRNSDQKPLNVNNYTLVFNIIEIKSQQLLVSKDFTVISAEQGQITLTLTELNLNSLLPGSYHFSIVREYRGESGEKLSQSPLYVDSQYGSFGVIEVFSDLYGEPKDSTVIDTFDLVPANWPNDGTSRSELAYASPELSTSQTIHTFAIYQTDYKGMIYIEASTEQGGTPRAGSWTVLKTLTYPSDVRYINVEGKWNWFRVKHIPYIGVFEITLIAGKTYSLKLINGGRGYSVDDQYTIKGSKLGGSDGIHDLIVNISSVDQDGKIINFSHSGVSNYLTPNQTKTISLGSLDKVLYR